MEQRSIAKWETFTKYLRSIHNCNGFYDYGKPWVTHCSIQSSDIEKTPRWLEEYEKPVVIDECCYEGNIPDSWGNIPAQELVNRMWTGWIMDSRNSFIISACGSPVRSIAVCRRARNIGRKSLTPGTWPWRTRGFIPARRISPCPPGLIAA